MPADLRPTRLADVSEEGLLARILPLMRSQDPRVLLGPGDDAAVLAAPDGRVVITTDAMTRGPDWLDEWSTGADVGAKSVAQNLGDVAAMGSVPLGLVVTLLADTETPLAWVEDLAAGIGRAAAAAGCPVLGGDLGGAPAGQLTVSITAFGDLQGRDPVLRSGARAGDVLAVAGTLGRSAAGLALLVAGRADQDDPMVRVLVEAHRAPVAPYHQGPIAADAGATSMLDLSDGLIRDAGRIAAASGVLLAIDTALLASDVAVIGEVLPPAQALECALTGGEEHSLLATFPADTRLPEGWRVIGAVRPGSGVTVDGVPRRGGGWDHFSG